VMGGDSVRKERGKKKEECVLLKRKQGSSLSIEFIGVVTIEN